MKFLATVILSTVLLFATNRSTAQIDPVLAANLQSIIDSSLSTYGLKGVEATVILPDECEWTGVAGYATALNDPVDTLRYWHWASTTKALTAAIVLQLHEDGLLDINDPIGDHWDARIKGLTSINGVSIVDSLMPIRHFLNHTTNIPNTWYNGSNLWNHVFDGICSVWTLDSALNPLYWEDPNPVPFDPAQNHQYGSWNNYVILTLLVEAVTGNSFSMEAQNRIFNPLGMNNSILGVNGVNMQTLNGSHVNTANNSFSCRDDYLSTRGGSSWLISSSKEVARFIRAFHTSQLVSPVLMDQVHQKAPGPPFWPGGTFPCLGDFEMYYGYGTEIAEIYLFNSSDTLRVYGHGGNGLGNSGTFHSPDSSITISVTTNDYSNSAGFGTGQVLSEIFCLLFGNITPGTCLTGVEETTGSSGVSLYPNPGSEQMVVKMSNGSISERIEILTIDGKLLYEYQNVSAELEISTRDLTEGVYLVRVFTDDGWVVSRWIKQ